MAGIVPSEASLVVALADGETIQRVGNSIVATPLVGGGGGGITSLGGQTGATQTFSKSDDTNVTLVIASDSNAHSFSMGWTGELSIARGGTGQATAQAAFDALAPTTTTGDILVYGASSTDRLGIGSDGQVLIADSGQGVGLRWGDVPAITSLGGQTGSTQTFTKSDDTNVELTITSDANAHDFAIDWAGQLSISRGGTGSSTAAAAFDALAPSTTRGDLLVFGNSSTSRFAVGTDDQVLIADSAQPLGVRWGDLPSSGGPAPDMLRLLTAASSLNNNTSAQPWFSSNGAVALESDKTYYFRGMLRTLEGTTSHSVQIGFSGTATIAQVSCQAVGVKRTMGQAGTTSQMAMMNSGSLATVTAANTTGGSVIIVEGVVRVTTAGTFVPEMAFSAAPGSTPQAQFGTYFALWEIGDGSVTSKGTWSTPSQGN